MTAVLEYLAEEVLDLGHEVAKANRKTRIIPQYLQLAIRGDDELRQVFANVTISEGGVVPQIAPVLLPTHRESSDED